MEKETSGNGAGGGPMTIPGRVWSSAGWLIVGRLFGSGCTVLMLLALSRHLDEASFGRLSFWIAAFLVLDGIVDFGAGQVAVQRSSRRPHELPGLLVTARRARLGAAVIVTVSVAAVALTLETDGGVFLALAGLYQLSHVLELSTIGWRNAIRWRSPVIVRAGASFTSLALVLALRMTGEDRPLAFLLAIAIGSTLGNVMLHVFGRRGLPPTAGAEPARMGPFLRASIPLGAAAVCQQLYFHLDNVFVRALKGDEAVGHYGVAVRVMSLSIMAAVFAASAALPWLSRAHAEGRLAAAASGLAVRSGAFGILVAAVLFPARDLVLGAFGEGFLAARGALTYLLAAGFFVHIGAPLLTAVLARGEGNAVLKIAAAGLAINVAGNAALTPSMGIEGAAIATVATEAWVALAAWLLLRQRARAAP